jgi:glycine dehydrogenase subunit 2
VVRDTLAPFLPVPVVVREGAGDSARYRLDFERPQSIGKMRSFYGSFGVLVRAYAYIRGLGPDGLRRVSDAAVLNANYVLEGIRDLFEVPYDRRCMQSSSSRARLKHGSRRFDSPSGLHYGVQLPTVSFHSSCTSAQVYRRRTRPP